MTFSLRSKLFLLVFFSIALAVVPLISFTYRDLQHSNAELERKSFGNMGMLVEDSISSRYLNLLTSKVVEVLQRKDQLRRFSLLARSTWLDVAALPSEVRQSIFVNWAHELQDFGIHIDMLGSDSELLLKTPQLQELVVQKELEDFKGRRLSSLLRFDRLPPEGEFAVFSVPQACGEHVPLLLLFLPIPEMQTIVVSGILLSDIEEQAAYTEKQIIQSTQEKFDSLQLSTSGFFALLQGDGKILAFYGSNQNRSVKVIPREALNRAKKQGVVEYIADDVEGLGRTIFRVSYTKALDWYVVSAAPQAEIEASTNALVSKLISIALVAVFISIMATLYITIRLTEPLRALTRKTHELSTLDFTAPEVENAFAEGLPIKRSDEVGQLARAYATVGHALSENVRALMDTTAAKERMQGELNAAHDIQVGILPSPDAAPQHPSYRAAAFLEPAKEVGGDLYDFFEAPDGRQVVIIGDVSGKGVPAALFMSMTVTLCRYAIRSGMQPGEAMSRINEQLSENNPGCMFVTLFIGMFNPETGVLDYANGGHCFPCVVDAVGDAKPFFLEGMSGPLVGALAGIEYSEEQAQLRVGQRCLLYTDGVTEAMNEQLDLFGDNRLLELFAQHRGDSPQDIVEAVYEATVRYRGEAEQSDDITMLCFTRHEASGTPAV